MKTIRILSIAAACLLGAAVPGARAAWDDFQLEIKVNGGDLNFYSYEELLKIASVIHTSSRATKERQAIALSDLLLFDGQVELDDIDKLILRGAKRSMILEGENVAYLDRLMLRLGTVRPSIAPDSDETWRALQSLFGQPRLKDFQKIYVYKKQKGGGGNANR